MNPILMICIAIPLLIIFVGLVKTLNKHFALKKVFDIDREVKELKKETRNIEAEVSQEVETVGAGYTYLGESKNHSPIYMPNDCKHVFVCGTTGSGKTVALSNFIKSGIDNDYPMLIVDGKGDIGKNSIVDIVNKLGAKKKIYVVNLNNPVNSSKYNPFRNATPTIVKDMLINLTEWSEERATCLLTVAENA